MCVGGVGSFDCHLTRDVSRWLCNVPVCSGLRLASIVMAVFLTLLAVGA